MAHPEIAMLTQPTTIFTGQAPQRASMLDLQNVPGMNNSLGMVLSMVLQPLITQLTSNLGYAGLQFGGTQSMYDRMQAHDFFLENRKAISEASQRDQQFYTQRLLGISRMTGTIVGPNQINAAQTMASDIAKMGVVLGDVLPDLFDELHGTRGSAALMARRIHLGGRFALDPISGEMGMRGETAGQVTNEVFDKLFGPTANITEMRGFGAGRIGQLYDELSRRGLLAGAGSTKEAFRRASGGGFVDVTDFARDLTANPSVNTGVTTPEFDAAERQRPGSGVAKVLESPEAAQKIMELPSTKAGIIKSESEGVSSKLKNLVGAVSAMRDIFGDIGKHDAPMSELINGLQALTQGGLSTMTPGQLEQMVRRMQQLSKMSGITLEGMTQLLNRGAALSDQLGLDRRFAVLATQGSAAFAAGINSRDLLATPGWKQPDKDTLLSIDQSLRLNAARSDIANQFNATLRIANEIGVDKNTNFAKLAKAVQFGETEFVDTAGKKRSVVMPFSAWRELAEEAGIAPSVAFAIRTQTIANQEYGAKFNTGDLARLLQKDVDINPILQLSGQIAFQKITQNDQSKAQVLAQTASETLWNMKPEIRNIPAERYRVLTQAIKQQAEQLGLNVADTDVRQSAVRMWTDFEQRVGERMPALGGAIGAFAAFDPATQAATQQQIKRANDRALLATSLSGLGRVGMLRRFMDMMEKVGPDTTVTQIVGDVLAGGVPRKDFADALSKYGVLKGQMEKLEQQPPSEQREDAIKDISQQTQRLIKQSGLGSVQNADLAETLGKIGELQKQYNLVPFDAPNAADRKAGLAQDIEKLALQAREQAEAAGYSQTGVSADEAKKIIRMADNMEAYATVQEDKTKPPSIRKPVNQPEAAKLAASQFMQAAQGFRFNLLFDDNKLGLIKQNNLLPELTASRERWQRIHELAFQNSVSVEELLTGTGQAAKLIEPVREAKGLWQAERKGLEKLRDAIDVKPNDIPQWVELRKLADQYGFSSPEELIANAPDLLDAPTVKRIEGIVTGSDLTGERKKRLEDLSKSTGVPVHELLTGTGDAYKLDVPGKKLLADILGGGLSKQEQEELDKERQTSAKQISAQATADALIKTLHMTDKIKPETRQLLETQLLSATTRTGVTSMLASYEKIKRNLTGTVVDGKVLEKDADVEEALIDVNKRNKLTELRPELKQQFQGIQKILDALEQSGAGIEKLIPSISPSPAPGAQSSADKPDQKLTLAGPIQIQGEVAISSDGRYLVFDDVKTINHQTAIKPV